ncbi:YfhO family protein [Ignavibacteria bacterium]|nr:YfhO family protein [Bacteroidota bacterium]MCZ2133463.1 YfhO family protein [Bacteroidota bacterium]
MGTSTYQSAKQQAEKKPLVPEKYQDWVFIALLVVSVFIYFAKPIFGGGSFSASDNIASNSFTPYLEDAEKSGVFAQWNPYIFSGLPSYAALLTTGDRWWDFIARFFFGFTDAIGAILANDIARIASFYAIYGIGMYLLMRQKKHGRFASFITGFAAIFSTFIITWAVIGHNTKPVALATFPFILLSLEKLREKFSFLYAALLIAAVHVLAESTHVQMIFYGVCTFGLYLLFELIHRLVTKSAPMGVIRAGGLLAIAGGIAFCMSADRYLSVMEYKPYSTRGTAPLVHSLDKQKQDETGGFDYDYCTNWSFSPQETITFFVPNYYGYGKLEYKAGRRDKGQFVQTYWGQMPFTDAANYMGIIVLGLAFLGLAAGRRDTFVLFLTVLSLFGLFLSFGKNLPFLYDLFFYNVPGFNNFRAPMMSLALMQFAVPILAGYGITATENWREKLTPNRKKVLLGGIIAGGLFLFAAVLHSGFGEDSYAEAVKASGKIQTELVDFIVASATSDMYATSIIALGGAVLVFLYAAGKLNRTIFVVGLALLIAGDLWRVDYRGMEVLKGKLRETEFRTPEFVEFLKQDSGENSAPYRVADYVYLLTGKTNVPAYFRLQNVHGYHSAKLRVYQDLLDVAGNPQQEPQGGAGSAIINPFLLNLLNVKYMISPQPLFEGMSPVFESSVNMQGMGAVPTLVYRNDGVLPRAFFVDSAEVQPDGMAILQHIRNGDFNPRQKAFVEEPLDKQIQPPAAGATAHVTDFRNEYIGIDVTSTGNNLLIISEVYYPEWRAYLDGQEIPIHKTNFVLRSVVVPAGKHKLELKYESPNFNLGKSLSLWANILTVALGAVGIFLAIQRKKSK